MHDGIQTVHSQTQLTMHHILSVFNIASCHWNAPGPVFLQSSWDSVVEELLILVFQPAMCSADYEGQRKERQKGHCLIIAQ